MTRKHAIVLLSGGLDSSTVLALATNEGFAVSALSFQYGQRHTRELDSARALARRYGVMRHEVVTIDLAMFGGSALTSPEISVPKGRDVQAGGHVSTRVPAAEIPVTYVPARNTIFLSFALAFAEVMQAHDIFIGVNSVDYSGYPDCRPEYIAAFERMANLATKAGVEGQHLRIRTPLISLSKAEIIKLGVSLGVDYGLTVSCYDPTPAGEACGLCDACQLRLAGFAAAGIPDPAVYVTARDAGEDVPRPVQSAR